MSRTRSSLKRPYYGRDQEFVYEFSEIAVNDVDDKYISVVYDVSDGNPFDPATTVERRVAFFKSGNVPVTWFEDYRKGYSGYFEGLKDSILDERIETVQEGDMDADEHRDATRSLAKVQRGTVYTTAGQITYADFMDAIERVANDENDEEAWKVIDKWRSRQLRMDER